MQSLIVKEIKFIEINCDIDLYFFAISVHLRRVRIYLTSIIEVRTSNGQIKNKKDGQIKNDTPNEKRHSTQKISPPFSKVKQFIIVSLEMQRNSAPVEDFEGL